MKTILGLLFAGACLAIALSSGLAAAQPITLPLGQVHLPIKSVSCPSGYDTGTACYSSTISCPSISDISFIYGVFNPGGTDGTIVFFNGDDGEQPGFTQYISAYTPPNHNYQTVQAIWLTPWEDTGNGTGTSLKDAACRPATLMDWLLRQKHVYNGGGMCAQGASAGSAAVAFALTQYGAGGYLQHVVLESGPVLSNIATGCNKSSTAVQVCPGGQCFTGKEGSWSDSPVYVDGAETAVSLWTNTTGNQACSSGNKISEEQYDLWTAMSIVDGITGRLADTTFSYPNTTMSGWLCSKPPGCHSAICQNNSAAQGQLYYTNVTSRKNVYRVNNCFSTEGVEEGTVPQLNNEPGLQAIIGDMVSQCR